MLSDVAARDDAICTRLAVGAFRNQALLAVEARTLRIKRKKQGETGEMILQQSIYDTQVPGVIYLACYQVLVLL